MTTVRAFALGFATILLAASILMGAAPAARAADETVQRHEGVLSGTGFGLHVTERAPWRATHAFDVVPGILEVEATVTGSDAFGGDFWVSVAAPDGEWLVRSAGGTAPSKSVLLGWPTIDRAGHGRYTAVVECGTCGLLEYELELRSRWAAHGANVTADETHLVTPPWSSATTGIEIVNTGRTAESFKFAVEGLHERWTADLPTVPRLEPYASYRAEFSVMPHGNIAPGVREEFDLVVSDAVGVERDRVAIVAAYTKELAELKARGTVVVALVDTGINPYHEEFGGPGSTREHPAWFVDGYPTDARALDLSLDAPDYASAKAADAATWASVPGATLHYVPGTRIIGMICFGSCSGLDEGGHGTGTASLAAGSTLGEAPEALIVAVTGDIFAGARWAARQPWIDVVSMSLGLWAGTPTVGVSKPLGAGTGNPYVPFSMPYAQKTAYESGKRWFTGSAQGWGAWATQPEVPGGTVGVSGPCTWLWTSSFAGTPWTFAVETYWPWTELPWRTSCTDPDLVAKGWDLTAASAGSLDGTNSFGHSSGATPQAAGAYAQTVLLGRRLLGSAQEGPREAGGLAGTTLLHDAVLARASPATLPPTAGPLADGTFTAQEAQGVFLHALEQVDVVESFARHGTDPRWPDAAVPVAPGNEFVHEGYGLLTQTARAAIAPVLEGSSAQPMRPEDDAQYAANFARRFALWEPHVEEEVWVF